MLFHSRRASWSIIAPPFTAESNPKTNPPERAALGPVCLGFRTFLLGVDRRELAEIATKAKPKPLVCIISSISGRVMAWIFRSQSGSIIRARSSAVVI
jgi:hypothetical protein